ncbi:MAG TPA: ATP-dependent DNA helicase RecG [Actinomycetota bacterium]|nr:ATP-dependent DNA helicase RecG [Actinomycetota bacterium]
METVTPPPRGLELFASEQKKKPLRATGSSKKLAALGKLGIATVQDMLQHYPRRHIDRTKLRTIRELKDLAAAGELDPEVTIHARVEQMGRPFQIGGRTGSQKKRKTMIKGRIADETGSIEVTWFNQDWVGRALAKGAQAFFYGRLSEFRGKLQMTAPRFEIVKTGAEPFNVGRIIPIYPATADITSDQLRKAMWETFESVEQVLDPLPDDMRRRLGLMTRGEALRLIHFPEAKEDVMRARRRLVFDELFTLQLGLVFRKRLLERTVQGIEHPVPTADSLPEAFVSSLPFELTSAQRDACGEVSADMAKRYPMHRLLEGEVGSGKTVVALYGCLLSIEGGRQAAFMAPTEVLAEQHHLTVGDLLERAFGSSEGKNLFASISRRPVVRLLTGSTPAADRETILAEVAAGEVDLLIGTHSLIQEGVVFKELGLAVVDEQHRFGVHQRKSLREKGSVGEPDILVMTATPIPRTLAVTIYGDLDLSILDELPKGRRPITTALAAGDEAREEAYELIRREVGSGRQAFIVYALRDESDKVELRSAKAESKRLAAEVFPDLSVGLVHGDMKSAEKEAAMDAFRNGEMQVLVATTVIEVGVDIPNATVMMIEDADRFGLAQLHQLRGRVGRGEHDSFCILATDIDLAKAAEDPAVAIAAERLFAVESTLDGFRLAEVDLQLRGQGQLFGARQSGMPDLKLADDVLKYQDVIKMAREEAVKLLDGDPELREFEHQALEREMRDRFPEDTLDVVQSG